MAKKKNPDWTAIKAEYLKGGTSYRKLADKYGVSSRTIERRAKAESWGDACRQVVGMVSAELPQKVAGVILDEAGHWVAETIRINRELRAILEERFSGTREHIVSTKEGPVPIATPFLNGAQDFKAVADTLAQLDKVVRQALGLDAKNDEEKDDSTLDGLMEALAESRKLARGE